MLLSPKDVNLAFFRDVFSKYDYIFFVDTRDIKNVYFKNKGDKFEAFLEIVTEIPEDTFNINFLIYLLIKIDNVLSGRFENYVKYTLKEYSNDDWTHKMVISLLFNAEVSQ